jgi:hypothetical protein
LYLAWTSRAGRSSKYGPGVRGLSGRTSILADAVFMACSSRWAGSMQSWSFARDQRLPEWRPGDPGTRGPAPAGHNHLRPSAPTDNARTDRVPSFLLSNRSGSKWRVCFTAQAATSCAKSREQIVVGRVPGKRCSRSPEVHMVRAEIDIHKHTIHHDSYAHDARPSRAPLG